jgi:hypothetical protein
LRENRPQPVWDLTDLFDSLPIFYHKTLRALSVSWCSLREQLVALKDINQKSISVSNPPILIIVKLFLFVNLIMNF